MVGLEAARHPVGASDQGRHVSCAGEPELVGGRVEHRVETRSEVRLGNIDHELVQRSEQLAGRQAELGIGPHRSADLAHHRRRVYPPAHHVAYHQPHPARSGPDDVVPVAADLGVTRRR